MKQRQRLEDQFIQRSMKEPDFRKRFLENPKFVIEEETGVKLPPFLHITVLEEDHQTFYLVLPMPIKTLNANATGSGIKRKQWLTSALIILTIIMVSLAAVFNMPPDKALVKGTMRSVTTWTPSQGDLGTKLGASIASGADWIVFVHFDNDPVPNHKFARNCHENLTSGTRVYAVDPDIWVSAL